MLKLKLVSLSLGLILLMLDTLAAAQRRVTKIMIFFPGQALEKEETKSAHTMILMA